MMCGPEKLWFTSTPPNIHEILSIKTNFAPHLRVHTWANLLQMPNPASFTLPSGVWIRSDWRQGWQVARRRRRVWQQAPECERDGSEREFSRERPLLGAAWHRHLHCHGSVKCLKPPLIFGEHANDPTKGKCVCVCVSMLEGGVFKIPVRAWQVEFSSLNHLMGAGRIEGRQKDCLMHHFIFSHHQPVFRSQG